jgi:hypothetical protein
MRKDRDGFLYTKLPPEERLQRLAEFEALLVGFNATFRGTFDDYTYSIPLVSEIYKRIDQRADYYLYFHSDPEEPMEMSQAKEIALMAFWILKYKPLSLPANKANSLFHRKNCTINEYFVAYCIASCAVELSPREDIIDYFSPPNNDVIVYNFMHRDISKEAMIFYVESLLNIVEK